MPGTIRMIPTNASRSNVAEWISPSPTYRNGSTNKNAARRKARTAMFTQVTQPKALRYSGRSAPRSASSCAGGSRREGFLRDTKLRGGLDARPLQALRSRIQSRGRSPGPKMGEQGRGDVGDPAWRGKALDAFRVLVIPDYTRHHLYVEGAWLA